MINGALIGGSLTVLGDVLLQWYEHFLRGKKFGLSSIDSIRTIRNGLIGAGVGTGLGYLSYNYRRTKDAEQDFHADNYLKEILQDEGLKRDSIGFSQTLDYRRIVKDYLSTVYRLRLVVPPEDAGSFYKRTAIGSNYDVDIVLAFKKNQFSTLEEMYYDVLNSLQTRFGGKSKIKKQRKSIGLTFSYEDFEFHFDIVPGREIRDYRSDKKLNLYVRPDWFWQNGTLAKSHVGLDKAIAVNKPQERKVIKLIKAYRDRNGLNLPTTLIEQCVVKALSNSHYGVSMSKTHNLLNSMEYIISRLENGCVRDITNSNNDLAKDMSEYEMSRTIRLLRKDVSKANTNQHHLKEIFELY